MDTPHVPWQGELISVTKVTLAITSSDAGGRSEEVGDLWGVGVLATSQPGE